MIESLMLLIQLKFRKKDTLMSQRPSFTCLKLFKLLRNCSTISSQLSAMNQAYL
ncbi:unnamed protein product [Paramecium pentaurelia]|uniref:Uncharacterized protein n=1 Tax=Paramecium pentaurelia TaxID=43138 RepID=A0A8S1YE59_9CILI|nr:unnamed protein product [Paramecium pentaurelia]